MISDKKQEIVGQSSKVQEVLRTADLVAGTDVPVLIIGETGTGKDLFAQGIHNMSQRKKHPFIRLSCSSISEDYARSLVSGGGRHVKGNTDSMQELIAQARFGTLCFDEITELSLELQAKLLSFIENGEIQQDALLPARKYNVRIIAASNKNLTKEVETGKLRSDLYYRLNVIPLELPVLAEREGDVSLLIEYFFREFVRDKRLASPVFTKTALRKILQYNWPGNIRELRNFCERMFILFSGKDIDLSNLPHEIRRYSKSVPQIDSPFGLPASGIKLESVEIDFMLQALDKTSGNKSQAARLLGLTRDTFLYRLKKYSIDI